MKNSPFATVSTFINIILFFFQIAPFIAAENVKLIANPKFRITNPKQNFNWSSTWINATSKTDVFRSYIIMIFIPRNNIMFIRSAVISLF